MKHLLLSLLTLFALHNANSQNLDWAIKYAGPDPATVYGSKICIDASDFVYTTGMFIGNADFDPGPGTYMLDAGVNTSIYFAKHDKNGILLWAKMIGTSNGYNTPNAIKVASDGSIYIAGQYYNTIDFDPGAANTFTHSDPTNTFNGFIARYDNNGNFLKVITITGYSGDVVEDLEIDHQGNIVCAGSFYGTTDLDPGIGVSQHTASDTELFLTKYTPELDLIFAKSFGGSGNQYHSKITIDNDNTILMAVEYYVSFQGDPANVGAPLSNAGDVDIAFAKYDENGNFVFAKGLGSSQTERVSEILSDESGNIFLALYSHGSPYMLDADPGNGTYNITGNGSENLYLGKYDPSGNFEWGFMVSNDRTSVSDMIIHKDNIHLTGFNSGNNDFDPGNEVYFLNSNAGYYYAQYDLSGNFKKAFNIEGTDYVASRNLEFDSQDNLYIFGYFKDTCDFDPGIAYDTLIAPPNTTSAFLTKYSSVITSLKETQESPQVSVYPNPSEGSFSISLPPAFPYDVSIYSTSGKRIYQVTLHSPAEKIMLEDKGLFLVVATDEQGNRYIGKVSTR